MDPFVGIAHVENTSSFYCFFVFFFCIAYKNSASDHLFVQFCLLFVIDDHAVINAFFFCVFNLTIDMMIDFCREINIDV